MPLTLADKDEWRKHIPEEYYARYISRTDQEAILGRVKAETQRVHTLRECLKWLGLVAGTEYEISLTAKDFCDNLETHMRKLSIEPEEAL